MYSAFLILLLGPVVLTASLLCHIVCCRWAVLRRRAQSKLVAALAVVFVGSYLTLAANGEYVLANHGGDHWTMSHCPLLVMESYMGTSGRPKIRPTILAAVYAPLFVIDRMTWHPDREPWDGYYEYINSTNIMTSVETMD